MTGRFGKAGMTLVELLVAVMVMALGGLWLLGAYHSVIELTEVSQQSDVAINDLRDMMERIKTTPFTGLAASFPNGTVNGITGGGPNLYAPIVGTYTLNGEQITVVHRPNATADPRELIVTLQWSNGGRAYQRSLSTIRVSEST